MKWIRHKNFRYTAQSLILKQSGQFCWIISFCCVVVKWHQICSILPWTGWLNTHSMAGETVAKHGPFYYFYVALHTGTARMGSHTETGTHQPDTSHCTWQTMKHPINHITVYERLCCLRNVGFWSQPANTRKELHRFTQAAAQENP